MTVVLARMFVAGAWVAWEQLPGLAERPVSGPGLAVELKKQRTELVGLCPV